jgi:hypothetical protein
MNELKEHNLKILKCITFIFVIFPFCTHIYSSVFPMIYNFDIAKISIFIIFLIGVGSIFENRIIWYKDINYFIPFLLVAFAGSMANNDFYFIKYFGYIVIYFYFLRRFFLETYIFKLYVNILVITFLIMAVVFLISLFFDLYTPYRIENLQYISSNSPMQYFQSRAQIFYILLMERADHTGIFSFSRFYGFSREPGMYVMFIIPGLLMAFFFNMRLQTFILTCAVLLTSSYAGFLVMALIIFMGLFPTRYNRLLLPSIFISILLIIVFRDQLHLFNSQRLSDYVGLIDQTLRAYNRNLASNSAIGLIFILTKLTYLLILYNYYRKAKFIEYKLPIIFLVSFVVLLNKSTELLSPLFLFYLCFIDYMYVSSNHSNFSINKNKVKN